MNRGLGLAAGLLLTLAVVLIPFGASNYVLRIATIAFMYVTLASSWNIVGGLTGYPSFATAAFFGIGAYASGIARVRIDAGLPLAWAAGAFAAGAFAVVVGPAILRLRGHYFAVASLVLAAVLRELVNSATITGGGMGLNIPGSSGGDVTGQARLYYGLMFGLAVLTVGFTVALTRSRLGWAIRCIEQNEDAAIVLGIDTLRAKVAVFAASAVAAGAAGALYATWIGYIDASDVFDDLLSVKPIIMAFLGGVGTILGPVVGAVLFLGLEELVWRNVLNFHAGILGLLVVVLLVFAPGGIGVLARRLYGLGRRSLRRPVRPEGEPVGSAAAPS